MSLKTLPILFLNLGGEMIYILDQRLRVQNILNEKAKKVLHDILSTMLNKRFMLELFKPQDAYSKKAMRIVFDRLAHASIMRLNAASMDKLYDLMTMGLKHQVSLSKHPSDVLMCTLNHMDTIREFAMGNDDILEQVDTAFELLKENYSNLSAGEFQLIRQTLLSFFQDMHIRVSIFLKDGSQSPTGRFILKKDGQLPWGTDSPGTIKFFDKDGQQKRTLSFDVPGKFCVADKCGSFELLGDRVSKLGLNMYNARSTGAPTVASVEKTLIVPTECKSEVDPTNELAKAELNLLDYLISSSKTEDIPDFTLNLFETDEEEGIAEIEYAKVRPKEIIVDATQRSHSHEISKLIDEFTINSTCDDGGSDDLLDLMDSA